MSEHEHRLGSERPVLTLADIEAIEAGTRGRGKEQRFCCPLPACEAKPRDRNHRSLSLEVATGLWHCFRCGASGLLREAWTDNTTPAGKGNTLRPGRRAPPAKPENQSPNSSWEEQLGRARPLAGSVGERYLTDRGITSGIAAAAGSLFALKFFGRTAVVFPMSSSDGTTVAVHGRYIDGGEPRMRTAGPKTSGVFTSTGLIDVGVIAVTEAPIDALSLAVLGMPAIATCGTSWPEWLPSALMGSQVNIAFDADDPGDSAAAHLGQVLSGLCVQSRRLRPAGVKDWNDALMADHGLGF